MDRIGLNSAIDQLYSGDPAEFVATRKSLVSQLRADGEKDLAATVAGLRRPTHAAAAINSLAREHNPPNIPELAELGEAMRKAQADMDAAALKTLSTQRHNLIADLLKRAEAYGVSTAAAQDQLSQSFTAALASAEAEEAVCSGQLVNPLAYSGFGDVEVAEAVAVPLRELQQARLDELAARDAERRQKPTRVGDDETAAAPKKKTTSQKKAPPTPTKQPKASRAEAKPQAATSADSPPPQAATGELSALYQQCLELERQAQEAVETARAALAAAKEHAAAATAARQRAEDALDAAE